MARDGINWAKMRGLSKKSYFPDRVSKSDTRHIIGCHAANFALGYKYWVEKPSRGAPKPFQALAQLVLPGIEPIANSPCQIHCKLRDCFFA